MALLHRHFSTFCGVAAFGLMAAAGSTAAMQGSYATKLTKPVDQELTAKALNAAKTQLRAPLLEWIDEHTDIPWDTANAVYRYHLSQIIDACAEQGSASSTLREHLWTHTLTVSDEVRHAVIVKHNARQDSLAISYWQMAVQLAADKAWAGVFRAGSAAAFHAMGHVGTPLTVAGDSVQTHVRDRARALVRSALSRISIESVAMVVEGKPGYKPTKAPVVLVTADSAPLPSFPLCALLPKGRRIAAGATDAQGRYHLSDIPIPYVANGTFLNVKPNLSGLTGAPVAFEARDLGVTVSSSHEPTFIYKVTPPRYSLRYAVNAVNQIDIPKDFSGTQFLEKYLRDSCFLVPQQGSEAADLGIEVRAQVSRYTNDQAYTMDLKVEAHITIDPLHGQGERTERQMVVHERSYDLDKEVSTGLFFWEATGRLFAAVKSQLNGM